MHATLRAYLPTEHCAEGCKLMWMFLKSVGEETFLMLPSATQNTSACPCPMRSSTPSMSQLGRREPREPFQMMVFDSSFAFLFIRIVDRWSDPFCTSQLTATKPFTTTTIIHSPPPPWLTVTLQFSLKSIRLFHLIYLSPTKVVTFAENLERNGTFSG